MSELKWCHRMPARLAAQLHSMGLAISARMIRSMC